ncbi:MAG: fibrobacter succinogenes major paralogous domain-containing protein, partial [Flavobacteriales bacterium]
IELELLAYWALDELVEGGVDLSGGGYSGTLQNVSSPVETTYCFSCETKEWAVDFPEPNCGDGTVWDAAIEECVVANPSDTDFDGCVGMIDLLDLLSVFGTCNEAPWSCGEQLEYQGYDYETVQIGDQCWFAENARFLPEVSPAAQGSEVDGLPHAYVYGYDGSVVSEAVQSAGYANGALYNFDAVVSWEICPAGWYVPGDEDWMILESFLGMDENELEWFYPEQGFERGADEEIGFKLKSVEWDGGNSTGFSALSNGWRWTGVFAYPEYTNFWTSTQISPEVSWARILREGESGIARQPYYPHFGKSVRCVQESE